MNDRVEVTVYDMGTQPVSLLTFLILYIQGNTYFELCYQP